MYLRALRARKEAFAVSKSSRSNKDSLGTADFSFHSVLEWFAIECHKTKTKAITSANQKGQKQYSEPIKTQRNYM